MNDIEQNTSDLALVLREHELRSPHEGQYGGSCSCGWSEPSGWSDGENAYPYHLAEELVLAGVRFALPEIEEPQGAPVILTPENRYSVAWWATVPGAFFVQHGVGVPVTRIRARDPGLIFFGDSQQFRMLGYGEGIDLLPDGRIVMGSDFNA